MKSKKSNCKVNNNNNNKKQELNQTSNDLNVSKDLSVVEMKSVAGASGKQASSFCICLAARKK